MPPREERPFILNFADGPILTGAEEQALARAVQAGDRAARDRLVTANLRLVVRFAKQFRNRGIEFDELVAEGCAGLIRAAEKFEPGRGKFSTYAVWWIQQRIRGFLGNANRTVRMPCDTQSLMTAAARAADALRAELGREPSAGEVAAALKLSPDEARRVRQTAAKTMSNFTFTNDRGQEEALFSMHSDCRAVDPADAAGEADERRRVAALLGRLDPRAAKVLRLRFGFDGAGERSTQEVAEAIGRPARYVAEIERAAMADLRRELESASVA